MKNRLIKFRVWNSNLKKFEEDLSNFWVRPDDFSKCFMEWRPDFDGEMIFETKETDFIYQQFTGLLDCNGKEIYEGDILAYKEGDFSRGNDGFDDRLEVFWDNQNSKFGINFFSKYGGEGYTGKSEHLSSYVKETQIIGNIFETPDLL